MAVRTRRSLSFQSLENRLPFAGDLTLQSINGDLFITGDGDAEALTVHEFKLAGGREVLAITGQYGTTINGQSSLSLLANNIRNVDINLAGGNDTLTIQGLDTDVAGGDLRVRLGAGTDSLSVIDANFSGDINLLAENDGDQMSLRSVQAGNLLFIDLGAGDDQLQLTDTRAQNTFIQGGLGNDQVGLLNADSVDQLFVDLNLGNDTLFLRRVNADLFFLNGGGDNDTLTVVTTSEPGDFTNDGADALANAFNFETVN